MNKILEIKNEKRKEQEMTILTPGTKVIQWILCNR